MALMSLLASPAFRKTVQIGVTGAILVVAAIGARSLWVHYQADPWTRDGRVRADVVQIAPDVQGLVTRVDVVNDQPVHKGDVLFQIDTARYALAVREAQDAIAQADAGITRARVALAEARREAARNRGLGDLVPLEVTQQSETKVADAQAQLAAAQVMRENALSQREAARLNLARTTVRASVDGTISDQTLRPGNYVAPGKAVMALVDNSSLRIEGYFEETKLAHVHVGQAATVRLMGEDRLLKGHVTSIAMAIEDHDRTGSASMLPSINPSFSWVRLPQRVPVRIALDERPAGVALIAGRTASVTLAPDNRQEHAR
jgi:RND family efflux transporter MFP subunit